MGGVAAAAGQGVDAVFLNPAVLSRLEPESPSELAFGYDALIETAYSGLAAFARPVNRQGAFAVGLLYASQRAQTSYNGVGDMTGSFTPSDAALGGWYAHRLGPVSAAGGVKLIRSALAERSAMSGAVDIGLLASHVVEVGDGPLDLGLAIQHVGPPIKLGAVADPLPARARVGMMWRASPTFDAGFDLVLPVDQDPYMSMGVESRFPASMIGSVKPWTASVRAGFDESRTRGVDGLSGLSAGGGLDFFSARVDYAWIPYGDMGSVNRITLGLRF